MTSIKIMFKFYTERGYFEFYWCLNNQQPLFALGITSELRVFVAFKSWKGFAFIKPKLLLNSS